MSSTRTPGTSDFRPVIDARLSAIPDLFDWGQKQGTTFWNAFKKMDLPTMQENFPPYCPHCLLDRKCMTLMTGRKAAVTKGTCIQCQVFLKTGKRGAAQR